MEEHTRTADREHNEPAPTTNELHAFITSLASKDVRVRAAARRALVQSGQPTVEPLTQALRSPNHIVRWEAAKALSEIADPASAPALIQALMDERFDVRW